ncbi:MAG: CPBP family intramembrane metalloprotease [Hyphomicrobiales bacterium]|nr:CPBP family intramembrane metalloprotease [Hyphomicrobiales bacterium]MCP4997216.1 CPBP family intramembrane metalloprotease [Hyphomicrobiales bacterium]
MGTILVPLVAAILFQAAAEELFFRGYLLQQLNRRWRHWLI